MKKIVLAACFVIYALGVSAFGGQKPVVVLEGNNGQVRSIVFTDGSDSVITAGLDSFIRKWDLKTGRKLLTMGQGYPIECAAYSRDGLFLASAGRDASIKLWDKITGNIKSSFTEPGGYIFSLSFSPDSAFLAAGGKNAVYIFRPEVLKKPFLLETGGVWSKTVAFSPDGRFFMAAGGNKISVWNVERGDIMSAVSGRGGIKFTGKRDFDFGCLIFDAGFSPDSQYFSACGDDGTIKTWRAEDGLIAWKQPAHNGIALCMAFSGDLLATAGKDGMINFFDIKSGRAVFSIAGCSGQANALAFSPDGKLIASACPDYSVRIWKAQAGKSEFLNIKTAMAAGVFLILAGIIALFIAVFRKKISVKDWKV